MAEIENNPAGSAEDAMKNRFLTFRVGTGIYGIEISYVTEIVAVAAITKIPGAKNYVLGIMNLRGQIVPVIDLSIRFGGGPTQFTYKTCIINLTDGSSSLGLIADEVHEVLDISEENIRLPPKGNAETTDISNAFVSRIGHVETGAGTPEIKQILDINVIFEEN